MKLVEPARGSKRSEAISLTYCAATWTFRASLSMSSAC